MIGALIACSNYDGNVPLLVDGREGAWWTDGVGTNTAMMLSKPAKFNETDLAFRLLLVILLVFESQTWVRREVLGTVRLRARLLGPEPLCRTEAAILNESVREDWLRCILDFRGELGRLESSCISNYKQDSSIGLSFGGEKCTSLLHYSFTPLLNGRTAFVGLDCSNRLINDSIAFLFESWFSCFPKIPDWLQVSSLIPDDFKFLCKDLLATF